MNARRKQKIRTQAERLGLAAHVLSEIDPDLLRMAAGLIDIPEVRNDLQRWADLLGQLGGEAPAEPGWTPFCRGVLSSDPEENQELLKHLGFDEIWMNSRYQVNLRRQYPHRPDGTEVIDPERLLISLSIKRLDKDAIHDWRDFQRIKNELLGPECEAMELYPAESRLVDTSNQYWLWGFPENCSPFGNLGFQERLVMEGNDFGVRQRPFDDPRVKAEAEVEAVRLRDGGA